MPPRRAPIPESFQANLEAGRLLANSISSGMIKKDDRAAAWKSHPTYCKVFSPLDPEIFRKRFKKLITEKYGSGSKLKNSN